MSQSIQATQPCRIGEPEPARRNSCPENLSPPLAAKRLQTDSWSAPRMLTQKAPARSTFGQLVDDLSGKNATIGGSSDTDVNEPMTSPAGPVSGSIAVTTQTPVGYCPRTVRNHPASTDRPRAGDGGDVPATVMAPPAPPDPIRHSYSASTLTLITVADRDSAGSLAAPGEGRGRHLHSPVTQSQSGSGARSRACAPIAAAHSCSLPHSSRHDQSRRVARCSGCSRVTPIAPCS